MAIMKALMFNWNLFSLAVFSMMLSGSNSMKSTSGRFGIVNEHDLDSKGNLPENEMVSKMVYDGIQTTTVKKSINVSTRFQKLSFTIYSPAWALFKNTMGQRQTRIANIKFHWSPTTKLSQSTATIACYDARYQNDGYIANDAVATTTNSKKVTGKIITAITFDPNLQHLIVGSLDFATATKDLHFIEFYISFSKQEMDNKATFGFLDVTWQTAPGTGEALQKIHWDKFIFPPVVAPEVKARSGKNFFEYMKKVMSDRYNREIEIQKRIDDITFEMQFPHDGGSDKLKNKITELKGEIEVLSDAAQKHKEAITLKAEVENYEKIKGDIMGAIKRQSIDHISRALGDLDTAESSDSNSGIGYTYLKSDA